MVAAAFAGAVEAGVDFVPDPAGVVEAGVDVVPDPVVVAVQETDVGRFVI